MIGQIVSHYRVIEKLGEGGMGVVYLAEDLRLKRSVVLKFISERLVADEEARTRLVREAQAAAALDHPNICTVYEIDEYQERTFIAMAFVEGKALAEVITNGPLELAEAFDIACEITAGISAAHRGGVVHRDLKPGNIMCARQQGPKEARVKILDFGLARLVGQSRLSLAGSVLGTAAYMSPEQAQGEVVDHRTDIWACGVILYEMITGQLPFPGEYEQAIIYSIINSDPEPVAALRSGLPSRIERILEKSLAKDPKRRYQHADELLLDLEALNKELTAPDSFSTPGDTVAPSRLHDSWVGKSVGHYVLERRLDETAIETTFRARDKQLERTVALHVIRPDAPRERQAEHLGLFKSAAALNHPNLVSVHEVDEVGDFKFAALEWTEGKTLDHVIETKGLPWQLVADYLLQIIDALESCSKSSRGLRPRIHPRCIIILASGTVKLQELVPMHVRSSSVTGQDLTNSIQETNQVFPLEQSTDILAYLSPEELRAEDRDIRSDIFSLGALLYEAVSGHGLFAGESAETLKQAILHEDPTSLRKMAPSAPRSLETVVRRCVEKDREKRYQSFGELGEAIRRLRTVPAGGDTLESWHSEPELLGRYSRFGLYAALTLVGLAVFAVSSWKEPPPPEVDYDFQQLTFENGLTHQPAISRDGKFVTYVSDRGGGNSLDVWVQQIASGTTVQITQTEANEAWPLFSPDGSLVVYESEQAGGGIYASPSLGGPQRLLANHGTRPRVSPDGQWVAFSIDQSQMTSTVWVVSIGGGTVREVATGVAWGAHPIWSPDGKSLLFEGSADPTETEREIDWRVVPFEGGPSVATGARAALQGADLVQSHEMPTPAAWTNDDKILFSAWLGGSSLNLGRVPNLWRIAISSDTRQVDGKPVRLSNGTGEAQPSLAMTGQMVFTNQTERSDLYRLPIDTGRGRSLGEPQRVTDVGSHNCYPSVSASGELLAFATNRAGILDTWMKNLKTGFESPITAHSTSQYRGILSPDGSQIALARFEDGQWNIRVMSLESRESRVVRRSSPGLLNWSPDGTRVVYWRGRPIRLETVDVQTGESSDLLSHPGCDVGLGRFSPDNRWLSFRITCAPGRSRLCIAPVRDWKAAAESEWIEITNDPSTARNWWSPDGNLLYYLSSGDGSWCIWAQRLDPDTKQGIGEPFAVHHFHNRRQYLRPGHFGYGMTGNQLYFALNEATANIWLAVP
jgi:serine/threonine protein kinase